MPDPTPAPSRDPPPVSTLHPLPPLPPTSTSANPPSTIAAPPSASRPSPSVSPPSPFYAPPAYPSAPSSSAPAPPFPTFPAGPPFYPPQYYAPVYSLPTQWPPPAPAAHPPHAFAPPPPFYPWPAAQPIQHPHPHPPPPQHPHPHHLPHPQQRDRSASPRHRRRHDVPRPGRGRQQSPRASRRGDLNPRRFQDPHVFDTDDDPNHNDGAPLTPQGGRRSARRRGGGPNGNPPHPNGLPPGPLVTSAAAASPGRAGPRGDTDRDFEAASAELDRAAQKAVASADEVTLALLLTSWANSLGDAAAHGGPAASVFESVFHGSQALQIVADGVLQMDIAEESAVRKALVSLLGIVLYGDRALHCTFAEQVVRMNGALKAVSDAGDRYVAERKNALRKVLAFLRDVSISIRAYEDVLPSAAVQSTKPRSPAGASPHPASGPAGPDPTKAVERSMDAWRRAMARLQGEMAIVVVLTTALDKVDKELRCEPVSAFLELEHFYSAMRETVKEYISKDVEARKALLSSRHWVDVTTGADSTVFEAAKSRAELWLSQFEASRSEVESQLDDAGIGFGPSARVLEDKFSVLVSASAGVAALVSCHQHAFCWARDVAILLSSMVTAFHALERMSSSDLGPPGTLKKTFFKGVEDAFASIDNVVNWSFASLHDKVLGSLEKSTVGDSEVGNTQPQKPRLLRFEEPPKTPVKDGESVDDETAQPQSRRKPRHARMKSSPDALLHLNAHFDDYSDSETELDREIDREIESSEEREGETGSQVPSPTKTSPIPENTNDAEETSDSNEAMWKRSEDELPVVYEGEPLEYNGDEEDPDDHEIIVHEDNLEDAAKPKKVNHTSHVRSMSVDGIPF